MGDPREPAGAAEHDREEAEDLALNERIISEQGGEPGADEDPAD